MEDSCLRRSRQFTHNLTKSRERCGKKNFVRAKPECIWEQRELRQFAQQKVGQFCITGAQHADIGAQLNGKMTTFLTNGAGRLWIRSEASREGDQKVRPQKCFRKPRYLWKRKGLYKIRAIWAKLYLFQCKALKEFLRGRAQKKGKIKKSAEATMLLKTKDRRVGQRREATMCMKTRGL